MFIQLNLPDGSPVFINPDTVIYFIPKPNQALETVIYFTNGQTLTVAQIPSDIMAMTPSGP